MAIEVTSGNSTLIQSQVASLLVQPLEQASTFLAAGPVVLDSSSPVRVPRIVNGVTAGFVAEGAQITDGDVAFDEVMVPIITTMAKAYTRGFDDGEPNDDIAAVITTASARLAGNTEQLSRKKVGEVEYEYSSLRGCLTRCARYTGARYPTGPDAKHTDSAAVSARTVTDSPAPPRRT